jgi:hypothetical protein
MAKSKTIKNAVVTLLDSLQLDGEPAFLDVKGYPADQFDGFPFVFVEPGDQSSEKAAYGQNDRTVALVVHTHVPSKTDGSDYDYLYDLTDLILDALDAADFNDSLNELDATITSYILNATRGDWYLANAPAGAALAVDINVEVKYSKNL